MVSNFATSVTLCGYNQDSDAGAFEDVWNWSLDWVAPTSAQRAKISSLDNSDAAAGAGARTVLVQGLDASWDEASETVSLNGGTSVYTTTKYIRLQKMTVASTGSLRSQKGAIIAYANTDNTAQTLIGPATAPFDNIGRRAIYSIPAGKVGLIRSIAGWPDKGSAAHADFRVDVRDTTSGNCWQKLMVISSKATTGKAAIEFDPPLMVTEKSDIRIQVQSSANNQTMNAHLGLEIV